MTQEKKMKEKTSEQTKAVAVVNNNSTELTNSSTGGRGFGEMSNDDLIIPYAKLMQPLSPEIQDDDSIKAGMIVNSLTKLSYGKSMRFIPLIFQKKRIKWNPREEGGGINCSSLGAVSPTIGANHSPFCAQCKFSKWENNDPPKCDMFYTFPALVLGESDRMNKLVAISFTRSSFGAGKKLINMARFAGGDIFSRPYELTTKKESNDKGTFFVLDVKVAGALEETEYQEAEQFYEMLSSMNYEVHQDDDLQNGKTTEKSEGDMPF